MNYQELIAALEAHYEKKVEEDGDGEESIDTFAYDDGNDELPEEIGKMEEVEQHGGEGEGDDWYSVKFFPKHNIYIKVSGYYSSESGTSFDGWEDDCKEVTPKEKMVTVYE